MVARIGFACLVFAALAAGRPAAAGDVPSASWTQFRLNPQHNAVVAGTLRAAWTVETHGPISGTPTFAGGMLYIGNYSGRLTAIDAATGRVVWVRCLTNSVKQGPLAFGDALVVGTGNQDSDVRHGVVHVGITGENAVLALDRATGQTKWRTFVAGAAMPSGALVDGALLEHNGNGDVVAFDPATGAVRYTRNVGTIPSMSAMLPLAGGTVVSAGQTETSVVGVRASDGGVIWRHPFEHGSGVGDCPPASDGVHVFCDLLMPTPGEPFVWAGTPATAHAFALDARTGALVWDALLERGIVPRRNQTAIPLVDGATVFMGSALAPYVHALDVATGKLRWRTRARAPVLGGIVAVDGTLYYGDLRGYLWAVDERSGRVIGQKRFPVKFRVASPVAVGQTLVIGSETGRVIAVPLDAIRMAHDAPKTRAGKGKMG